MRLTLDVFPIERHQRLPQAFEEVASRVFKNVTRASHTYMLNKCKRFHTVSWDKKDASGHLQSSNTHRAKCIVSVRACISLGHTHTKMLPKTKEIPRICRARTILNMKHYRAITKSSSEARVEHSQRTKVGGCGLRGLWHILNFVPKKREQQDIYE